MSRGQFGVRIVSCAVGLAIGQMLVHVMSDGVYEATIRRISEQTFALFVFWLLNRTKFRWNDDE